MIILSPLVLNGAYGLLHIQKPILKRLQDVKVLDQH